MEARQENVNTGLVSLEIIARMNNVDIDMRSIVREYAISSVDITPEELIRIAKNKGFKVKLKKNLKIKDFPKNYPLPAIVQLKNEDYLVILGIKHEENKVLTLKPLSNQPEVHIIDEFQEEIKDFVLVLSHKANVTDVKFGFKWFFNEIYKYKKIIAQVLLGSFVIQLFGLVTPLFTQVILDKVLVNRTISTLDVLAFAFVVVAIFELLLNLSRNYIFIHTTNKIDAKLGAKLFKHLFQLYYTYFETRQVGNIAARVRELDRIREFITDKSVSVLIDAFFSLVFLAIMFVYSPKLTFISLGFLAIIAIIYVTITPELRERLEEKFQMGAHSNSYLVESITGVQTVKSLAIEGSMFKKWEDKLGKYLKSSFNLAIIGNFTGSICGFLQKGMTIAILYVGVMLVIDNKLTIGQLIAFQMFSGQFSAPMLRLVGLWNEFQQTLLAVDRIGDILNSPIELQSKSAITLSHVNGDIKVEHLSFKYNVEAPYVLNDINLDIKAGQKIGFVGRSGSGKSTIAKLIQRLYYATQGTIYIDGIDIRNINPVWLRTNIGIVLQENYLFSGTIKDNISLPRPNVPMEGIIQAAKIAGAHEFISKLPKGYDTEVGERGSSLSGGQKQRIAIARALISNPKILIFDEATSALDYESEKIIKDNMVMISKGRTTIVIAHRLSTIKDCDLIVCFDNGQIVEIGTHEDLLQKDSYYKKLYLAQAG
ncbi:MAG: type I secretion system permease/ATPase [Candidatus Melainabacteria bacterium]|nr:MAG: type I secretion system permease/ATPase [Candidatus Melainabacteria bacterium]